MFLAFVLLIGCFGRYCKSMIERMIYAVIVWNGWSFLLTELLSLFHIFGKLEILVSWGILDLVLIVLFVLKFGSLRLGKLSINRKLFEKENPRLLYVFIAGITLVVLALAVLTVPYNWDSMTYHLSRIAQWAQNRSVAHYATNDVRQLTSPVLAEFVNAQVYILTGCSDRLLNLLQAGSYIVNAFLVFAIARKLGCKEKFAAIGTLLFMLMPIAFGEALTTQVDQFAAIWFLIFVYYYVDLFESKQLYFSKETVRKCILMGLCISFGYLAKPSVDMGMAVLLLILLVKCIRRKDNVVELVKLVLCVIPFVVIPILPEVLRNYRTFAAFSDPIAGKRQLIGTLAPNYVLVNLVKNLVQNIPSIYLYDSNEWMAKIVMVMAGILGVNINDPAISEDGREYVLSKLPAYGHDSATNPLVVILAIICLAYCLVSLRKNKGAGRAYTIYSTLTFILFCAFVRWEPFVTRYMLAYLAALCPMIAWQLQEMTEKCRINTLRQAMLPIVCFCLVTETFALVRYHQEIWHEEASVRPDAYFYNNKSLKEDYLEVTAWIQENDCEKVGLSINSNQFLYPVWAMLKDTEARLENVLVENVSAKYEDKAFIPDCIISSDMQVQEAIQMNGYVYEKADEFEENEHLCVFVRMN